MSTRNHAGPFKLFVVWDSQIHQVKTFLQSLERQSSERLAVEQLGLRDGQGVPARLIRSTIEATYGVLALVDQPNANVGLEIGFALGLERPVALGTLGPKPAWCAAAPFDQHLVAPGLLGPSARDAMLEHLLAHGPQAWVRDDRPPKGGSTTLLLCPHDDVGRLFAELVPAGAGWTEPPVHGWTLHDLGKRLDGVRRVVWIVPVPGPDDVRDGPETARLATLAGYALARGLDLVALCQLGERQVLDVFPWRRPFTDTDDLAMLLAELVSEAPGGAPDLLAAWRRFVHEDTRQLTPFMHALQQRDLPGVYVPLEVGGSLAGRTSVRALLEGGGHWALVADPGGRKDHHPAVPGARAVRVGRGDGAAPPAVRPGDVAPRSVRVAGGGGEPPRAGRAPAGRGGAGARVAAARRAGRGAGRRDEGDADPPGAVGPGAPRPADGGERAPDRL